MKLPLQPVIFCDFDGTITENDNIIAIMKHFNPLGWEPILERIISQQLSIRKGVKQMFQLFPSSMKQEIINYAIHHAVIRKGFKRFIQLVNDKKIDFLITSGGIDFFIYELLRPFPIKSNQIYCNQSDFENEKINIIFPHTCDEFCNNDCGMCKTKIVRRYPTDRYFRIVIGDSLTDFEAAKLADIVYARSHLIEKCEELSIPFKPFESFYEVIDFLEVLET